MKDRLYQYVHNIAEKYFYKYENSPHLPLRQYILPAAHYIIFPEFRFKEYRISYKIGYGLKILFVLLFISMMVTIYTYNGKLDIKSLEFWQAQQTVDSLKGNANRIVYNQVKDSFENSGEYLRFQVYKKEGIQIPERMSDEHVKIAVLEAEKENVPLRIVFRTIKHESNFDSLAMNPTSSAYSFMQVVYPTFKSFYSQLGLTGGKTPANNLIVGIHRLKYGYDYWKKRNDDSVECWRLAIAAYGIGDSLVIACGGKVPDTIKSYVNFVMQEK